MLTDVERFVAESSMVPRGARVLAAVSGGPDSMVLLDVLSRLMPRLDFTLSCACVDHGLRPEAELEADLVREQSAIRDVPFCLLVGDTPVWRQEHGGGIEQAAREVRMRLLAREARRVGASRIALGHTLDDQAETVLMRVIRGAGLAGLCAMRPVRDDLWIRPLLKTTRAAVLRHARDHAIPFINDPSNLDRSILRNHIRFEVMPVLEALEPGMADKLASLADRASDAMDVIGPIVQAKLEGAVHGTTHGLSVDRCVLARAQDGLARHIVREVISRVKGDTRGLARTHVQAILELARSGDGSARVDLPGGLKATRAYDLILLGLAPGEASSRPALVRVNGPGLFVFSGIELTVRAGQGAPFPLELRGRLPGDRLVGRQRKLKRLFIDRKVPRTLRDGVPLLTRASDVLWAGGLYSGKDVCLEVDMRPLGECAYLEWLGGTRT